MTFEEREKEIFFETIIKLTGGGQTKPLTKTQIVDAVGERITAKRANKLFGDLAIDYKYLDDKENITYTISDSGMVYYEYLRNESEKARLDKESVEANINIKKWTIGNIIIGLLLAGVTLVFVISNWSINKEREYRESAKEITDSTGKLKTPQVERESKKEPFRISPSLQDTAKDRRAK